MRQVLFELLGMLVGIRGFYGTAGRPQSVAHRTVERDHCIPCSSVPDMFELIWEVALGGLSWVEWTAVGLIALALLLFLTVGPISDLVGGSGPIPASAGVAFVMLLLAILCAVAGALLFTVRPLQRLHSWPAPVVILAAGVSLWFGEESVCGALQDRGWVHVGMIGDCYMYISIAAVAIILFSLIFLFRVLQILRAAKIAAEEANDSSPSGGP